MKYFSFFCKYFSSLLFVVFASTSSAQSGADPKTINNIDPSSTSSVSSPSNADLSIRMNAAENLIKSGKSEQAVTEHLNPVIAAFELRYKDDPRKLYAARSSRESLFYMLKAASSKDVPQRGAVVVPLLWSDALYLKAYALIDLKKIQEAKLVLELAVDMAPLNSQYLSELGHLFTIEKNYTKGLELYAESASAAKDFSPEAVKKQELTRAWRGTGYILIEKNLLDDAEKMYQQCLEIDKEDRKAIGELNFIRNQRLKQTKPSQ